MLNKVNSDNNPCLHVFPMTQRLTDRVVCPRQRTNYSMLSSYKKKKKTNSF